MTDSPAPSAPTATSAFGGATSSRAEIPALFAYKGIGHSDRVYAIDHSLPPDLNERTIESNQIENSVRIFKQAVADTHEQLEAFLSCCDNNLSPDHAKKMKEFIEVYLLFLHDDDFKSAIENDIQNRVGPAETCVHVVAQRTAENFRKMEDPYLAAKADDVIEVGHRLIRNILRMPQPDITQAPQDAVIVADSLSPMDALYFSLKNPAGIVLHHGSPTGHVADVARGMHLPLAFVPDRVQFQAIMRSAQNKEGIAPILDGLNGTIIINPTRQDKGRAQRLKHQVQERAKQLESFRSNAAVDGDGVPINLMGTADSAADVRTLVDMGVEKIGLFRTEKTVQQTIPTVEEQTEIYGKIFDAASTLR